MKKNILFVVLAGLIIAGAGCAKQTETNTAAVTTPPAMTNTTANTNATTGTFNTNTTATNTNVSLVNTNTVVTPATATVTINASGVSSKSLTVQSGTVVTFVNNHSRSHQIASDPHPDHTDLPGFDLALSPGSSKSFTFTKVGSWGYHDHDDPFTSAWRGTIVVQ